VAGGGGREGYDVRARDVVEKGRRRMEWRYDAVWWKRSGATGGRGEERLRKGEHD
jgi:hypothetical protein